MRRPSVDGEAGAPVPGVLVQAFDQELAEARPLGEATTDQAGWYRIPFSDPGPVVIATPIDRPDRPRPLRGEPPPDVLGRAGPDLWVAVPGADQPFLTRSDVVFDAGPLTTIDLELAAVPPPGAELDRLNVVVVPRLRGLPLAQLTDEQANFLGSDARMRRDQLDAAIAAARIAQEAEALLGDGGHEGSDLELPLSTALYAAQRGRPVTRAC